MTVPPINIGGIVIPFHNPIILTILGIHILAGLICLISGITAMISKKGPGKHRISGSVYFWSFSVIFITAVILSITRLDEDYYLLIIDIFAFASAFIGRLSLKRKWKSWPKIHITGMGISYILLVTAFYMDNGKNLPVWKDLPGFTYWLLPNIAGIPLIGYALFRYRKLRSIQ